MLRCVLIPSKEPVARVFICSLGDLTRASFFPIQQKVQGRRKKHIIIAPRCGTCITRTVEANGAPGTTENIPASICYLIEPLWYRPLDHDQHVHARSIAQHRCRLAPNPVMWFLECDTNRQTYCISHPGNLCNRTDVIEISGSEVSSGVKHDSACDENRLEGTRVVC